MTNKELCNMCTENNNEVQCENKDRCMLLGVLKENRKLKKELRELKKEHEDYKCKQSWRPRQELDFNN